MIYLHYYIAYFAIPSLDHVVHGVIMVNRRQFVDQKTLAMFIHLSQTLHFGKTALAFHLSPSTLSRQIQRLEQQVGHELLLRDNRSVLLTEAGEKFKSYAIEQQENWQNLQHQLSQKQQQLSGKLHIYCSVTAAYSHLPPLLERFRQQHPLVEIMLSTGDASEALEQVQSQSVDFAIAAKPENLPKSVYFFHLANISLNLISPTMHCNVQKMMQKGPTLQDLQWEKIPVIMANHGPVRKRFDHWFKTKLSGRAQSFKPNIYATVSGHEALVSMVALGCGIAMVPQVVVENSPVKDRVQYLEDNSIIEPFELGVCCLNQTKEQPLIKAFFDSITTQDTTVTL